MLLCTQASAFRTAEVLSAKKLDWKNADCAKTDTCDLESARFLAEDYRILVLGKYSYGTRFAARYKTQDPSSLEKYGFVQWIRGCVFDSTQRPDGGIDYEFNIYRDFFARWEMFRHPDWVLDSADTDPFYNSTEGMARHAVYRWNRKPGSTDKETERQFGQERPAYPELYVLDHPGKVAFFTEPGTARNISLELKTCIYRSRDVPDSVRPEETEIPGALACFEWGSSFVYDHAAGKFMSLKGLHPVCTGPLPRKPEKKVPADESSDIRTLGAAAQQLQQSTPQKKH